MSEGERILVIDDEQNMRHMLKALLGNEGYRVDTAGDGKEGLEAVQASPYDYILCDVKMPRMDGLAFLEESEGRRATAVVIMMSAYGSIDTALQAMKAGAYDFITKPFKPDEVLLTLKKAGEREQLRRENRMLREQVQHLEQRTGFGQLVTASEAMLAVLSLARKVAPYSTTVLITGESGTGKELVARGIHEWSGRAEKPFIGVNCGSIPESLLESEFFGYVKGAFTGADHDRNGLFADADGGTLFLDEIGELPVSLQVKLLRVLQEGEIRPVGGSKTRQVDVRLMAATARNLEDEVRQGRFRDDLYFRLNVVHLEIPPLRTRKDDIPLLCNHFLNKLGSKFQHAVTGVSPAALALLMKYDWPGNVRELENVMEHATIFAEATSIMPDDLPGHFRNASPDSTFAELFHDYSLKTAQKFMEKGLIQRALQATGGNKSHAAKLLEISYPSLLNKIKEYKISCQDLA